MREALQLDHGRDLCLKQQMAFPGQDVLDRGSAHEVIGIAIKPVTKGVVGVKDTFRRVDNKKSTGRVLQKLSCKSVAVLHVGIGGLTQGSS
ncbi:MAG: hypothetical protein KJO67_14605 [Silicimonas sp.]|nr:hypothetical protein [Silicimonas sp.]